MSGDQALCWEPETSGEGDGREPVVAGDEPVVTVGDLVVAGGGEHLEFDDNTLNLLDTLLGVKPANKRCDEPVVAGEEPISGAGAANVEAQAPSSSRGDGLAEDKPDGVRDEHPEFECSGKAVGFIFVPIKKYQNRRGLTPEEFGAVQRWRNTKHALENRIVDHEAAAKRFRNDLAAHLEDHPLSRSELVVVAERKRKWQVIDGDPVEPYNPFRPFGEDEEGKLPDLGPQVLFRAEAAESITHMLESNADSNGTHLPPLNEIEKRRMEECAEQEMGNMDKIACLS